MSYLQHFSLEGQTALVTGGATGIGQAIAVAFAEAGADVVVTTHTRPADETATRVEQCKRRFLAVQTDLSQLDTTSAHDFFDRIEREIGKVTILVNNAGTIRRRPAAEYLAEDWHDVLKLNLDAAWFLAREAGRRMLQSGHGKIINIASLLSYQGGITVPAYTASKHAIAGLTKALANEWAASGVNVNAIAPGYIATTNTKALREDETRSRQILERVPAGRWGNPEDLSGAAVFLASRASDYVHGHILVVDGGWMGR